MHPNPAFRVGDEAALLEAVAAIGFAHLFVSTPDGPMVVHAPLTRAGDTLRFHIARGNRATRYLSGATVLASIVGAHGYISPNWYAVPGDQVPTWNYTAIEIEGVVAPLAEADLIDQLDRLATAHEPRVNPAAPWTRAKMDDAIFRKMLRAILGFEITVTAIRGTTKLSQNKPDIDRDGVIAGLRASNNAPLADDMEAAAR